jgi:hypothetical protein
LKDLAVKVNGMQNSMTGSNQLPNRDQQEVVESLNQSLPQNQPGLSNTDVFPVAESSQQIRTNNIISLENTAAMLDNQKLTNDLL